MKNKQKAFTLIELLVVVSIIALLVTVLLPSLSRAKEMGKRAVCLTHLKQMQICWIMYADDNDDRICAANVGNSDFGWVARIEQAIDAPVEEQLASIENGMLFRYTDTIDIYRCPTARYDIIRSYSIVSAMNTNKGPNNSSKGEVFKKLTQIRRQSERMVFVDEGLITNHAFRVLYFVPAWKDIAPIRHSEGTTFSFVDGHAEYWGWVDERTISLAYGETLDKNQPGNPDLIRVQRGMWGNLGYDLF